VVAVDVFGQCANYAAIAELCQRFGVPLIEDAAEALGATFRGRPAGTFGDIGCFSFNGNKIITTSGGGMLITSNAQWAAQVRYLSAQARLDAPHYEHMDVGYNYRLSNLLAAIGRGQLRALDDRVARRRDNFRVYQEQLGDLPGLEFMPEIPHGYSTRWLTCASIDERQFGATADDVRLALGSQNIEARPVWKPMHLQPLYKLSRVRGGQVSEALFRQGLCLPSGSAMTEAHLHRVISGVKDTWKHQRHHAA
jgi:pyridoxal phosphate-dependent aminotransferase EpsN